MEMRWEMMIMHAKHCRNGWIKDKGVKIFYDPIFILFYFWGDLLILCDGRINFESVRVDSWPFILCEMLSRDNPFEACWNFLEILHL
jgi:hypothetical protein